MKRSLTISKQEDFSMDQSFIFDRVKPLHAFYRPFIMGNNGAVSCNNYYATKAGLEVLAKGGNAADAAVAVSLVLGVTEPYHSGIGGGCFTLYYDKAKDQFLSLDARGMAPIKAHRDMFLDKDGNVDKTWEWFDGKSVAAPQLYRALEALNKEHGTMSIAELSQPAIDLARDGFTCNFLYEFAMNHPLCGHAASHSEYYKKTYMKNGEKYKFGEKITNPDLADTMEKVAKNGIDWFYCGDVADKMVECVQARDGVLTKEDLEKCHAKRRPVVRGNFQGYDIVSMSPPSSGGSHIIQMLNILENFDLKKMGHNSAEYLHVLCETIKLMFADRSVAMGDPDYVKVDVERIISKAYAKECAARIKMDEAQEFSASEGIEAKEYEGNTTHFSIIDKDGNMIAQTQTVRSYWGSSVMCEGYGFIMNNAMSDFSAKVGTLTTQGLVYGTANGIEGGKTPLSSMTPTLVFKDGMPLMSVGAAGGPRIITGTLQLLLNVLAFDMNMDEALQAGYINCLTKAQGLEYEPWITPDTIRLLAEKGHIMAPCGRGNLLSTMVNGVMRYGDRFQACANNRHDGCGGVLMDDGRMAFGGITF